MKINKMVNYPLGFVANICRELKYDEFHKDTIHFVKMTKVGRIHIILNEANKKGGKRTRVDVHHDILADKDIHDHYTTPFDNTAKKAWMELESKIYEKILGGR